MKPLQALQQHKSEVVRIATRHHVANVRIFGSCASGADTESSDLDLLVDTTPETSLMDIGAIRYQLRQLLGVPVDVLTPAALPDKHRADILASAKPI